MLEVLEVLLHPAGLFVQRVQRREGRQVARVDGKNLFVGLDGAIVVAQPILPELADLQLQLDGRIRVVDDLRLLGQHFDQSIPGLQAPVQPLERVDGVDAPLVGVQRALIGVDGLGGVAQLRLVRVRQRQQDVDLGRRLVLAVGVARQRRGEVGPVLLLAVEVLQRLQRADVRGVQLQRLLR